MNSVPDCRGLEMQPVCFELGRTGRALVFLMEKKRTVRRTAVTMVGALASASVASLFL